MTIAITAPKFEADKLNSQLPLFRSICDIGGSRRLIEEAQAGLEESGVVAAIARHDNDAIFDWLIDALSYQGIGDSVASQYLATHGSVSAGDIRRALAEMPSCPKLAVYWTFEDCRYHEGSHTCAEPEHVDQCPLPNHDLRNGRLNQTAYSLFLFFRDVARGDFVSWLDNRLAQIPTDVDSRAEALGRAVLEPMSHVHGISSKVLSMALADLFLAMATRKPLWLEAGAGMIAIDSLVHNWMHRTGVLAKLDCDHLYGDHCYGPNGCAAIIRSMSALIDARRYNPDYPADFPRFVQKAIWWFCAAGGLDLCNGNRIDDRRSCDIVDCPLGARCQKRILHRPKSILP